MIARLTLLVCCAAGMGLAADQATLERGQKEEARACIACHSLRLIHSQRISKAAWNKEVDKMINWGSKVQDREALMEYLIANFGDDKPMAPPTMSGNGSKR